MSDYLNAYTVDTHDLLQDDLLKDDYLSLIFSYAVSSAIASVRSGWRLEPDAQAIIREDTFGHIWNTFPNKRNNLLEIVIYAATENPNHIRRKSPLSEPFSRSFLKKVYEKAPINDEMETNELRARVVPILDENFDYLSELHKFSLAEGDLPLYDLWKKHSISNSKDKYLYDYLWSQVKREKGAVDEKEEIVRAAIKRGALSDTLIRKIADSSPKRIKRVVCQSIRDESQHAKRTLKSQLSSIKRRGDASAEVESDEVELLRKRVAKLEARAMLFVGCDDASVVEALMNCLSRDNLPWLLPSASRHSRLGTRLNRILEQPHGEIIYGRYI